MPIRTLLVVYSYHHKNTETVARTFAQVLGAAIVTPQEVDPQQLGGYDLVGFGSGIDSAKHYTLLFDLADKLPRVTEPPRDCRRLNSLRGWRHGKTKQVLPRGAGTSGSDGAGARA
jgi:hypothetical protein